MLSPLPVSHGSVPVGMIRFSETNAPCAMLDDHEIKHHAVSVDVLGNLSHGIHELLAPELLEAKKIFTDTLCPS